MSEGPRTEADPQPADGTYDAYMEGFRDGKAEARADVDGLVKALDTKRLAEAWANIMDGRRIRQSGMGWARVGRETTTTADWTAIANEYVALLAGDKAEAPDPYSFEGTLDRISKGPSAGDKAEAPE